MRNSWILLFIVTSMSIHCGVNNETIITVTGPIKANAAGAIVPHEHVLVDFIGADSIQPGRYNADSVFQRVLPDLNGLKNSNCNTL
ncbi:MAG: hypothetical protein JNK79_03330, partial [Chitinophagaceae bacterium]|nr:hypothetical protein [Chitinophagaceae bacterium]